MRMASSCAATAWSSSRSGRRGEHLDADAVALHGLDHRVRGDLSPRRAGHHRGELPAQRHPLLDDEVDPAVEQWPGLLRIVERPHAAAVVAAGGRLGDRGPVRHELGHVGAPMPPGARPAPAHRSAVRRSRITRLSCACTQRVGARVDDDALAASARMCSPGTCSWSKVTTSQPLAKRTQRVEVGVVTDRRCRRRRGRRRRRARSRARAATGPARSRPGGSSGRAGRRPPCRPRADRYGSPSPPA